MTCHMVSESFAGIKDLCAYLTNLALCSLVDTLPVIVQGLLLFEAASLCFLYTCVPSKYVYILLRLSAFLATVVQPLNMYFLVGR